MPEFDGNVSKKGGEAVVAQDADDLGITHGDFPVI
jgi:hypothetical protein